MTNILLVLTGLAFVVLGNAQAASDLCPSANGRTITDVTGNSYLVTCSADNDVGSYTSTRASSSYLDCMTACDAAAADGCTGFTYVGGNGGSGSGTCWLKKRMSTYPSAPANYISAVRVAGPSSAIASSSQSSSRSLSVSSSAVISATSSRISSSSASVFSSSSTSSSSTSASSTSSTSTASLAPSSSPVNLCPSYNFTSYADQQDNNWQILCGFDSSPASFGNKNTATFALCLDACTATSGCVAVSYVGTTCWLKSGYSGLSSSSNVNSAFRINAKKYPGPAQNDVYGSRGCGSSLPAGVQAGGSSATINLVSGGQNRSFAIHVPSSYNVNKASPLIVAFHGRGETATNIENDSGFSSEITNPYGIAVYPQGFPDANSKSQQWQGDPATVGAKPYIDDQTFTQELLAHLTSNYCIDTSRMLATGMSNGGGFTGILACNSSLSRQFSAFAISSGAVYTANQGSCSGNTPSTVLTNTIVQSVCSPGRNNVPILEFHGDADGTIAYTGGSRRGYCLPTVPHWTTDWALRNSFPSTNATTPLANGQVTKYEFGDGEGVQGMVTHYKIAGWGHYWASSKGGAPIDASPIIMDFLYRYTNPNALRYLPGAASTQAVSSVSWSSSSTTVTSILTASSSISSSPAGNNDRLLPDSTAIVAATSALSNASATDQSLNATSVPSTSTSFPFPNTTNSNSTTISAPSSTAPIIGWPTPTCPAPNDTTYIDPSTNLSFNITCSNDTEREIITANLMVEVISAVADATSEQCISFCAQMSGCIGVDISVGMCYLRGIRRSSIVGEES